MNAVPAAISDTPPRGNAVPVPAAEGGPGAPPVDQTYRRFFELPLAQWPLFDSVNLRLAKIVLGSDLNPVIDFFNSPEVGIGGRNARQAAAELNLDSFDQDRLAALLRLRSYDVYTLRATLGNHLSPDRFELLALPETEKLQLEEYTREYTRSLFTLIFEDTGVAAPNRQAMREMLEGSSRDIVQRNVLALAQKFSIKPTELVNYIAGFGEMLLAIAFYRRAFESSRPLLHGFLKEVKGLHDNKFLCSRHLDLHRSTQKMLHFGARTMKLMDGYFHSFNGIGKVWAELTPERFRQMRDDIEQNYPAIGATLCIWQVKLNAWNHRFHRPNRRASDNSAVQLAVFFQERIFPDFDKITTYLDRIKNFDRAPVPPAAARKAKPAA
jgi:hypothetical protein